MSDPLYAFPPACAQTLRALARYPERTAFAGRADRSPIAAPPN